MSSTACTRSWGKQVVVLLCNQKGVAIDHRGGRHRADRQCRHRKRPDVPQKKGRLQFAGTLQSTERRVALGAASECGPQIRTVSGISAVPSGRRLLRVRSKQKPRSECCGAFRLSRWRREAYAALRFASISLRFTRHSAICTALSAAPLRRLSDTHHSTRPFSTVASSRMRLM